MSRMQVAGLWRYPVKSLGGERLASAELTPDGVRGDRIVHVRGARGPLTGRTRHGLLTLPVRTGDDGSPCVDGHRGTQLRRRVVRHHGGDAGLVADGVRNGSTSSTSLSPPTRPSHGSATTCAACARTSSSPESRRSRSLVARARTGDRRRPDRHRLPSRPLHRHDHRPRHRRTRPRSPAEIRRDFGGELALNCWVIRPGAIIVGDEARLVPSDDSHGTTGAGSSVLPTPTSTARIRHWPTTDLYGRPTNREAQHAQCCGHVRSPAIAAVCCRGRRYDASPAAIRAALATALFGGASPVQLAPGVSPDTGTSIRTTCRIVRIGTRHCVTARHQDTSQVGAPHQPIRLPATPE